MATITDTDLSALTLGGYLLAFDDENDGDGEAGTYDEAEYDDVERRALAALDSRLPHGWSAGTQTDEDGTYLVARNDATGRECASEDRFLRLLTENLDAVANAPGGVDLTDPEYLRSLLVPECDCAHGDDSCAHAYPAWLVHRMRPLVLDVLRFIGK